MRKKQLYEVNKRYYVMAENQMAAEFVRVVDADFEIHKATSVDHDWWNAIPFGSDDDRTCGQIIEESEIEASPDIVED